MSPTENVSIEDKHVIYTTPDIRQKHVLYIDRIVTCIQTIETKCHVTTHLPHPLLHLAPPTPSPPPYYLSRTNKKKFFHLLSRILIYPPAIPVVSVVQPCIECCTRLPRNNTAFVVQQSRLPSVGILYIIGPLYTRDGVEWGCYPLVNMRL